MSDDTKSGEKLHETGNPTEVIRMVQICINVTVKLAKDAWG